MFSKNKQTAVFFNYVVEELKKDNIKLRFYKSYKSLDSRFDIKGYFDEETVAVLKDRRWLETLVHEFSHYIQWKKQTKTYQAYSKTKTDPMNLTEKYILSKRIKLNKRIKTAFRIIKENEYECDKIAVGLIKKFKLPIEVEDYIQRSNHQIIYYHCLEKYKNTNPKSRFDTPEFIKSLPKKFNSTYINRLPYDLNLKVAKYFEYQ